MNRDQQGSYNVWLDSDGHYALEVERDGNWSSPIKYTRDGLADALPQVALELLNMIDNQEPLILYGDGIDIAKVFGWSLEVLFPVNSDWNQGEAVEL